MTTIDEAAEREAIPKHYRRNDLFVNGWLARAQIAATNTMPERLKVALLHFAEQRIGSQRWSIAALELHELLNARAAIAQEKGR